MSLSMTTQWYVLLSSLLSHLLHQNLIPHLPLQEHAGENCLIYFLLIDSNPKCEYSRAELERLDNLHDIVNSYSQILWSIAIKFPPTPISPIHFSLLPPHMILTNITTSTTVLPFGRVVNIVNQNQDAREARIYPLIPHRSQMGAGGMLANPIKPVSPVFPTAREVALGRFLPSWILVWSWFLAGGGAEFWKEGGCREKGN